MTTRFILHHRPETVSTNLDARAGEPGDVFTADYQSAGRGRLDHKWLSPPGTNLMMSVVLSVGELEPEQVATLPLVVGLAVCEAVRGLVPQGEVRLKWPNDVLVGERKICGILCERQEARVIAGIGVNVNETDFAPDIAARATSLRLLTGRGFACADVRDEVLAQLAVLYDRWRASGFAGVYSRIRAVDYLKGRRLAVMQTDDDAEPVRGISGGILSDGSLDVGGISVYAGEAHVLSAESLRKE